MSKLNDKIRQLISSLRRTFISHRYINVILLTLLLFALLTPFELFIKPLAREFKLSNPHISYPFVYYERISPLLLIILSVVLPIVLILFSGIANRNFRRHSFISVLGFLFNVAATMLVVDVLKFLIGNLRPDFLARCMPRDGTPTDVYVKITDVCTNPDWDIVWEGARSTPSGHSALSFTGLGFFSMWMMITLRLRSPDRPSYLRFFGYTPLFLAGAIAYSRIVDHKHHWLDVISGSLFGLIMSFLSYGFVVGDSMPVRETDYYAV